MNKSTDFTGIAYLTAIGLAVAVAIVLYRKAGGTIPQAARAIADAASSALAEVNPFNPNNVAARAADAMVNEIAGRSTSVGSVIADFFPGRAQKTIDAPGFWTSPGRMKLSDLRPLDANEFGTPPPFGPPGFIDTIADAPEGQYDIATGWSIH